MKEFDNQAAVFGGNGNMGKLTQRLLKDVGFETTSPDPRNPSSPRPIDAIRGSRAIFFSVLPIEEIPKIIEATQDAFGPSHLVLDNASVKGPLRDTYSALEAKGVSICSTHPLFKPDQPTHGQKALIMPVGANSREARELAEKLYASAGIKLVHYSFGDHDKNMVVVQALPHVVMRA
ncbi:MAG: hypothetical protein ACHQT7_02130, partial [Candidatus Levyibacteriota bacterium]